MHGDVGVLLLHGFGGEPFEMLGLADALASAGFAVSAPLLPGHGQDVTAWSRTGFGDWYGAAREAYLDMQSRFGRVFVMGLSMGGTLSLRLAQEFSPAGVLTVAAPVFLYRLYPLEFSDWRLPFVRLLRHVRPLWPVSPPKPRSREIAPWKGYEGVTALAPLESLLRGMREVRGRLADISAPLLALHARGDRTVPDSNAWEIVRRVSSDDRNLVLFNVAETVTSRHVLTTHRETRDGVARLAVDFVSRLVGNGTACP